MATSTTFSALFLRYLLPPSIKILRPRISFRVKRTATDNQYYLYSRTYLDGSSMIEGVDFTVSYSPVAGIPSLYIFIAIEYVEVLNIFVLDISNDFQNNSLTNTAERVYLSLPFIYLDWYKIKWPKHQLFSRNQKGLCIQGKIQYREQNLMENYGMTY